MRRLFLLQPALLCFLLLAGCSSSGGDGGPASAGSGPRADELCVSSDCGELTRLLPIPDAENLLFGPGGRLFVTGGLNIYEISRAGDGSWSARPLTDVECGFTGMAIIGNTLYANGCSDHSLFAGTLTAEPVLTPIFHYSGMCIPNGLAAGPDGNLYAVDEPLNLTPAGCLPPDPKIVRLVMHPTDPLQVLAQETWVQGSALGQLHLGLDNVLRFPNGIARDGSVFYATDGGSVFSVELLPDGSAGPVTPLFFEVAVHDDLGLVQDGILVTDFALGRISLWSRSGELLQQTNPLTFYFPSSVRLGQPPLFAPTDILVTEKGVITDNSLPLDFLSLFRRRPD